MLGLVLQASISNVWFELRRSVSGQRLAIFLVLAMFPPFIMFMVFSTVGPDGYMLAELLMAVMLWIVGLLSLILWLPPGIYSELEVKRGFLAPVVLSAVCHWSLANTEQQASGRFWF